MKLMNEKASLIERIQELEHVTIQLSHETETIGEYLLWGKVKTQHFLRQLNAELKRVEKTSTS